MNATALRRAVEAARDLPLEDLGQAGAELHKAMVEAIEVYKLAECELLRRMAEDEATILEAGDVYIEKKSSMRYDWDVDAIAAVAPSYVIEVPEEIIPAHPKVKNSLALNNYIAKLGRTPAAESLKAARRVTETNPKLSFSKLDQETGEVTKGEK